MAGMIGLKTSGLRFNMSNIGHGQVQEGKDVIFPHKRGGGPMFDNRNDRLVINTFRSILALLSLLMASIYLAIGDSENAVSLLICVAITTGFASDLAIEIIYQNEVLK